MHNQDTTLNITPVNPLSNYSQNPLMFSNTTANNNTDLLLEIINPMWDPIQETDAIETHLQKGTIMQIMPMRPYLIQKNKTPRFAGEVYIVLLKHEDKYLKAVLKPREGDEVNCVYAEEAAFRQSQWLKKFSGTHLVPPTIVTEYDGKLSSLQYFVESPLDLWIDEQREAAYMAMDKDDLGSGAAYTHVFGQWDCHPGNQIMFTNPGGKLIVAFIDNEGQANRKYSPEAKQRPYIRIAFNPELIKTTSDSAQLYQLAKPENENLTKLQLQEALQAFNLSDTRINGLFNNLTGGGERSLEYIIFKGGLWFQYHKNNAKAFPNYVEYYPEYVANAYMSLNLDILHNIFAPAIASCPEHYNDSYFEDIMLRRQQLLDIIKPQAKSGITHACYPMF